MEVRKSPFGKIAQQITTREVAGFYTVDPYNEMKLLDRLQPPRRHVGR
jgi:hypothetical protein